MARKEQLQRPGALQEHCRHRRGLSGVQIERRRSQLERHGSNWSAGVAESNGELAELNRAPA